MQYDLQTKISADKKLSHYLKEHSQWYKLLNRRADNFKYFQSEAKKYNFKLQQKKLSSAIDTMNTVNQVMKIIK